MTSSMIISIPHYDITIDPSSLEALQFGCLSVIDKVRPSWNISEVQLKTFTDGLTNKLVGAWHGKKEEMVLVRVYGEDTDKFIDREMEMVNMFRMSVGGCGSMLYASFSNGIAYQFQPGEILEPGMLAHKEIYRKVARAMAMVHRVELGPEERTVTIWTFLQKLIDLYPLNFQDTQKQQQFGSSFLTKDQMKKELLSLQLSIQNIQSPVVLCHNDPMPTNMVLRGDTVMLIDLEYASPNYQALDIANVFNEYVGVDGQLDYGRNYPGEELMKDWIAEYLTHFHGEAPTQMAVEDLYREVILLSPCGHLMWSAWAVIQATSSNIEFDYLGYAKQRLDQYKLLRNNI